MGRLIYGLNSAGGIRGGHKMAVRHVEALRTLGFDAWLHAPGAPAGVRWLEHSAPILTDSAIRSDDIVVLSEDDGAALRQMAKRPERTVIFYQGAHSVAEAEAILAFAAPTIITVGKRHQHDIRRLFPSATVEWVPCFADERLFKPGCAKQMAVAYSPAKRPKSAIAVAAFLKRLHPRHADLPWTEMAGLPEREVAAVLGRSSLCLGLGLFESVGLLPLEAMASDCVCAGFLGVGGWEFATDENGFWAPDDDQIAAADALAAAADLVKTGGAPLRAMLDAGRATAAAWSYAVFLRELERVWTAIAPQAQVLSVRAP